MSLHLLHLRWCHDPFAWGKLVDAPLKWNALLAYARTQEVLAERRKSP
jgi:hypothetical protein